MIDRAAMRACARIAWRQAKLSRARSALILALIALPIAGLTAAATIAVTAWPTPEQAATAEMGTADLRSFWEPGAAVEQTLPDDWRVWFVESLSRELISDGSYLGVTFEQLPVVMDKPPAAGMFVLLDGRIPRAPGEAAVNPETLEALGLRIGDRLTMEDLSVTVTGTAVRPLSTSDAIAVVAPDAFRPDHGAARSKVLIELPPGTDVATIDAAFAEHGYVSRNGISAFSPDDRKTLLVVTFAGAAVALFGTGLIVAAAFVVGLRRQLRSLGLLGAAGGDARHVRAVVLMGGASLGLVGALAGIALGIAFAFAIHPFLPRLVYRIPQPVTLHPLIAGGALVLGIAAATLAAVAPGRAAARLRTVDALASRTAPPPPPGRLARWGIALVVLGVFFAANGTAMRAVAPLTIGVLAILAGMLFAIPMLVSWVGRVSGTLPTVWRLAARDNARYGRRTGAALAAAALALTAPVAVAAGTLSEESRSAQQPRLADDKLLVNWGGTDGRIIPVAEMRARLREAFPGSIFEPLSQLLSGSYVVAVGGSPRADPVSGRAATSPVDGGELYVGSPALLRALDAEVGLAALAEGHVVALGGGTVFDGELTLHAPSEQDVNATRKISAVEVPLDRTPTIHEPRFFISAERARVLGLTTNPASQFLFDATRTLDRNDILTARQVIAPFTAYAMSAADLLPPSLRPLRVALTGISVAIALAIVAVAVALVRAESRRDQAILFAVGAGPSMRRRLAGANAALLAMLAGMIAIPGGFLPVAVVQTARTASAPIIVPWLTITAVAVAVPLIAGLAALLLSRAPRDRTMLQPTS